MKYTPDSFRGKPDLFPWFYIFSVLSTRSFIHVYDQLEFPFEPAESLRQLARDFVFTYTSWTNYFNQLTTLAPIMAALTSSVTLFSEIPPDAPSEVRMEALFAKTFARLEQLGYANEVYRWGKQTHSYYSSGDENSLHAWCRLLRDWMLQEINRASEIPDCSSNKSTSREIYERLQSIYPVTSKERTIATVPLPPESRVKLLCLILRFAGLARNLRDKMEVISTEKTGDVWEDFIMYKTSTSSWLQLEGLFRIYLREWIAIVETLSAEEMNVLNDWALPYRSRLVIPEHLVIPFPVPLPRFLESE